MSHTQPSIEIWFLNLYFPNLYDLNKKQYKISVAWCVDRVSHLSLMSQLALQYVYV